MFSRWNKIISWSLVATLVVSFGAYLYLLNDSVFATAQRRDNQEKIIQLDAEVSALEADYLGELSNINLDLAKKLGFLEATGKSSFATKDRPLGLLTGNDEN